MIRKRDRVWVATLLIVVASGCARTRMQQPNPVDTGIAFSIGSYDPQARRGFDTGVDHVKVRTFLARQDEHRFHHNDVVTIDGFKYRRVYDPRLKSWYWTPYPSRPEPKLDKSVDVMDHVRAYSEWLEDNPHLGYPPLPPLQ